MTSDIMTRMSDFCFLLLKILTTSTDTSEATFSFPRGMAIPAGEETVRIASLVNRGLVLKGRIYFSDANSFSL